MAERLIDSITGQFEPQKYDDTYRDALCEIIRAKRKGEEAHVAPPRRKKGPRPSLGPPRER